MFSNRFYALFALLFVVACAGTPPELQAPRKKDVGVVTAKVEAQYQMGVKYLRNKKIQQAYKIFKKINDDYPSLFGPYANLGIIYLKQNKLDDAEKALLMAIQRNDKVAMAHNQLGIVYRQKGEFKKARRAYQRALKIDPIYTKAHLNLGILYDLYLLNLNKALFHYTEYQKLSKNSDKRVKNWIADLNRRNKKNSKKPNNFSRVGQQ